MIAAVMLASGNEHTGLDIARFWSVRFLQTRERSMTLLWKEDEKHPQSKIEELVLKLMWELIHKAFNGPE
ncbi:hypothetical protein HanIR_Chr05g0246981 [Helianthus annuus]|nr:hypothetical protein HanIR_Chr05g0246981 [Helianthus annuus]